MKLGMGELVLILGITLLIFGPKKLPELGKAVGQTINGFRTHANKKMDEAEDEIDGKQ